MKRIFFAAVLFFLSISSFAQERGASSKNEKQSHNIWVEAGIGVLKDGDVTTGYLGARYTKMFSEYIGYDFVKIGVSTYDVESLSLEALTGLRGETPAFSGNIKGYANLGVGCCYFTDSEEASLKIELGTGLKLSSRFSVGVVYSVFEDIEMAGVRLSFAF